MPCSFHIRVHVHQLFMLMNAYMCFIRRLNQPTTPSSLFHRLNNRGEHTREFDVLLILRVYVRLIISIFMAGALPTAYFVAVVKRVRLCSLGLRWARVRVSFACWHANAIRLVRCVEFMTIMWHKDRANIACGLVASTSFILRHIPTHRCCLELAYNSAMTSPTIYD